MTEREFDDRGTWRRWLPTDSDEDLRAIGAAVEAFQAMDTDAGRDAEHWLKEQALNDHPSTVTWLYLLDGRLEGYYALSSTSVELTQRQRKKLTSWRRAHPLHPSQPASLIAWIAKHREAQIPGELLVLHATFIAGQVSELQGNIALVLDPYDDDVGEMWRTRYGFNTAAGPDSSDGRKRLWLPLD